MHIQIFPLANEKDVFYGRLVWYSIIGSGALTLFWFWDFVNSGAVTRDSWGLPRSSDTVAIIVWVAILAIMGRLAEYAHNHLYLLEEREDIHTNLGLFAVLPFIFVQRLFLCIIVPMFLVLSVLDIWKKHISLIQMMVLYTSILLITVLLYVLIIQCLLFMVKYFAFSKRHR